MHLRVFGSPKPKGSTRAFIPRGWNRPIITNANPKTKDWENLVRYAAQSHAGNMLPPDAAISLTAEFILQRPKATPKGRQHSTKKPDLDKLIRCVLDALTGICYRDDAQVSALSATKRYTVDDEQPGAHICVKPL